uniref:Uncharacterized protein n=1 Tax=Brassica oleracea var. oleracea TaxID=109376 RepID=A0A0D3CT97_BRAOL
MVEAGGVAPALTALVLKAHSSKDGTCIDKRAEGYVEAAEALALERPQSATATGENVSALSTQQLNDAYIEYVDAEPKESPAASLRRNVGVDGRLTTVEGVVTGLKDDVSGLKDDVSGLKQTIDLLLKMNGVDPITRQPIPRESGASAPSLILAKNLTSTLPLISTSIYPRCILCFLVQYQSLTSLDVFL